MKYIIFDMEWNQASPGRVVEELRHGEIIQIGFFVLDNELNELHRESVDIKPVCYPVLNKYVSALTGITQEQINAGTDFISGFEAMSRYFDDQTVLLTWGDDDLPLLRENLAYFGKGDLTLPPHYNLQRIFAIETGISARQTGLKNAAESLGIGVDIHQHEALNDAYLTVLIARSLKLEHGIAQYSQFKVSEPHSQQPWLSETPEYIRNDIVFSGAFDGMAQFCRKIPLQCPRCERELEMSSICRHGKLSFIATGSCPEHGEFFTRYELKDGNISVSCFTMNEKFDHIYKSRMKLKENRLKYKKLLKESGRGRRKKRGSTTNKEKHG